MVDLVTFCLLFTAVDNALDDEVVLRPAGPHQRAPEALRGLRFTPSASDQIIDRKLDSIKYLDEAVQSDTAGIPNTVTRIRLWGTALREAIGIQLNIPVAVNNSIAFEIA